MIHSYPKVGEEVEEEESQAGSSSSSERGITYLPFTTYLDLTKTRNSDGDDELRTTVHLPNIAPIGAKLRQNAFQTICNFRFFDAGKFFRQNFSAKKFGSANVFRNFRLILEEIDEF